jgi:hypothetical protein
MGSAAKVMVGVALGAVALGAAYQLKPEWFGLVRPGAPKPEPKAAPPAAKPAAIGNPRAGHDDAKTAPATAAHPSAAAQAPNPLAALNDIGKAASTASSAASTASDIASGIGDAASSVGGLFG